MKGINGAVAARMDGCSIGAGDARQDVACSQVDVNVTAGHRPRLQRGLRSRILGPEDAGRSRETGPQPRCRAVACGAESAGPARSGPITPRPGAPARGDVLRSGARGRSLSRVFRRVADDAPTIARPPEGAGMICRVTCLRT